MRIGKAAGCSCRNAPTRRRRPSSCRRPTSPAASTSATRSTLRCRMSLPATRGCWARTRSGSSAPTMPDRHPDGGRAQPRKPGRQARRDRRARPSLSMSGNGRRKAAAQSPASFGGLGRHATGRTSALRWTRAFRRPSPTSSSSCTSGISLYRDKRLVNWDPKFQTAISDLEVETRDIEGKFWTLSYPLEDGSERSRSRPPGPKRCSPTWRSRSIPRIRATRRWSGNR